MKFHFKRPRKDSTLLKVGALLFLLLYYIVCLLSDNEILMLCIHVLRVFAGMGVLYLFKSHWYPALNAERIGKVDIMALALAGIGIQSILHAGYSILWRTLGRPNEMMSSDWNSLSYVIGLVAMFALQAAQRNANNEVPRANTVYTFIVLMIGVCIGVLATYYYEYFTYLLPLDPRIGM